MHSTCFLLSLPPPWFNSSCLGASPGLFRFLFLFCPNQKVKKKSPLCYLYLASKLSLIFKYRPPSGFHQIWFTSTALRVIWITCKEVKCSSELTENLPKNWNWANHPFHVQSVCLPQRPSTFIFLCLQKKKKSKSVINDIKF